MKTSIPVSVLCALALGGCVPGLYALKNGYHQLQLVMLIPVEEAVYRQATGTGYYSYFGDAVYGYTRISPPEICTEAQLKQDITDKVLRCSVAKLRFSDDCNDKNQCGQIEFSPAVLTDPALRDAALAALEAPCSHLTEHKSLKWGSYPSNLGTSAERAWLTFKCHRRRPALFDVTFDGTVAQAKGK